MRRFLTALVGMAVVLSAGFWFLTEPGLLPPPAIPADYTPDLANGETMFWAGGCASCHAAPGAKGEAKYALTGGLELKTPFGLFRVPNISSDPQSGIGNWSIEDFVRAMTRGVSPKGEHYYPAFPYTSYQRMAVTDLIDLKAFLDSLRPMPGSVRGHELAFPYNQRRALGLWKLVYLDGKPFQPNIQLDAATNRGAYLVEGPGHCG
ncbi:MAG: alkylated DNA repair protein, partial [Hyphomicrobiales bacterium]|nr:alkylated DNA repair protein [Hyphomicrobiales bacterium]